MPLDRATIADWIPGYAFASDDITIDITAGLDDYGLTAAEAHATTGDVAEVIRSILESAFQHTQTVAASERLTNFRVLKSQSIDAVTSNVEVTYTVRFTAESSDINTLPEPS